MSYEPLFDVTARHDYFGPGPCPAVEFTPDVSTRGLESRAGLVIRPTPGGIGVYYDTRNTEPLRLHASDPRGVRFVFRMRATDVSLPNYTDPDSIGADSIFYYSSHAARVETDGAATWESPDRITDQDFDDIARVRRDVNQTDPVLRSLRENARLSELNNVVEPRDRVARPLAIVAVFVVLPGKDDKFPPSVPSRYQLGFRALQTIWKYYVLGELAQKESATIADLQGDGDVAEFDRGPKENLPGNRVAMTFRSRAPIPLRFRSERRFQLRENGKVLIRRLPVASAEGLGSVEINEGKKQYVSEIYVNG